MPNGFATNAVLLRGEVEGSVIGLLNAFEGGCGGVEIGGADGKGDVAQPEGVRLGGVAALAVLPGAEKEEESHDGQISDGFLSIGCGR